MTWNVEKHLDQGRTRHEHKCEDRHLDSHTLPIGVIHGYNFAKHT